MEWKSIALVSIGFSAGVSYVAACGGPGLKAGGDTSTLGISTSYASTPGGSTPSPTTSSDPSTDSTPPPTTSVTGSGASGAARTVVYVSAYYVETTPGVAEWPLRDSCWVTETPKDPESAGYRERIDLSACCPGGFSPLGVGDDWQTVACVED
jgi:hypothetical protein